MVKHIQQFQPSTLRTGDIAGAGKRANNKHRLDLQHQLSDNLRWDLSTVLKLLQQCSPGLQSELNFDSDGHCSEDCKPDRNLTMGS